MKYKAILESGKGKTFDKNGEVEYSKRTTKYIPYSKIGDVKVLYDERVGKFKLIESTKEDEGYIELSVGTYKEIEECLEDARKAKEENYIVDEDIVGYEDVGGGNTWDLHVSQEGGRDGYVSGIHQGESRSDTSTDNERSGQNLRTEFVIDVDDDGEDWVGAIIKRLNQSEKTRESRRIVSKVRIMK